MTVVLAGSFAETAKFARQQGLANIRHIVNRDVLRAMTPYMASEVHVLPSFHTRPDRHGIEEELRRSDRQFVGVRRVEWAGEIGGRYRRRELDDPMGAIPAPPAQTEIDGQTSIEDALADEPAAPEVIAEIQAGQLAALQSVAPVDTREAAIDAIEEALEAAEKSAAPVVDEDDEFLKMIGGA